MWLELLFVILLLTLVASISWTILPGAPFVPTQMHTVHKMLQMAKVGPNDKVYDLGCGDGRMVITAARHYGAQAVGIEIDPLRFIWCKLLVTGLGLQDRIRIVYGNFFTQNLSEADVVTCYLLQSTNNKLEGKLKNELRPGTRVVSNTFTFYGLKMVGQDGESRLYIYNPE